MAATLRLPLELNHNGGMRTLTQDSPADIAQSLRTLLSTAIGERAALANYGVVSQLGTVRVRMQDIAQAIADWEKRIREPQLTTIATRLADGASLSTINVIVREETP